MVTVDTTVARQHRWSPHLRGHLLLFDRRPSPAYTPQVATWISTMARLDCNGEVVLSPSSRHRECRFASRGSLAVPMFASIFVIGLFLGVLYRRSGNLWIVAVFHAIGNAYIVWSVGQV